MSNQHNTPKKVAFTVCSLSHLGQAKAMADSLISYNPDYEVFIGLVDRIENRITKETFAPHQLIEIEHFSIPNLPDLCIKYDGLELCCLTKPYMATYLFERFPTLEKLIYADTDMLFFGSVETIEQALEKSAILLTPHILSPYTDTHYPREVSHLNAGLYNAGFFALKRSNETTNFLDWWQNRLQVFGYVNFMDGMFVDQLWLNFVPLFFNNVEICKNLGLNCGYWNLHERTFQQKTDGQFIVNDTFPLIFFHFSGYNLNKPTEISSHTDRFNLTNRPELTPLFSAYHQALEKNQHRHFLTFENKLIPEKSYKKWGRIREFALRISRKIIRMWHG